jgi:hypothetical protein
LLTCYSPVRRSCTPKGLTARLACVKHAASVRPEPGSNSPLKYHDNHPTKTGRIINTLRESIQARKNHPHHSRSSQSNLKESNNQQTPHNPTNTGSQAACRLAKQTNSSTFSTLLSSQRSNAHHPQPTRVKAWGNPTKLTGLAPPGQTEGLLVRPRPPRNHRVDARRTEWLGFRRGRAPCREGLALRRTRRR